MVKRLRPYIEDFAQLVGINCKISEAEGVLCKADNIEDLEAIYYLVNKNALACVFSKLSSKIKPISIVDAIYMRRKYLKNYSKLKNL